MLKCGITQGDSRTGIEYSLPMGWPGPLCLRRPEIDSEFDQGRMVLIQELLEQLADERPLPG